MTRFVDYWIVSITLIALLYAPSPIPRKDRIDRNESPIGTWLVSTSNGNVYVYTLKDDGSFTSNPPYTEFKKLEWHYTPGDYKGEIWVAIIWRNTELDYLRMNFKRDDKTGRWYDVYKLGWRMERIK